MLAEQKRLENEIQSLTAEKEKLERFNEQQESLLEETEQYRQQSVALMKDIRILNEKITKCQSDEQDFLRIQNIQDKEYKKRVTQQADVSRNISSVIREEMAENAKAEKQEELLRQSENSLKHAKEEVATLEEQLNILAEKLAQGLGM